jgi:hypothetical protein
MSHSLILLLGALPKLAVLHIQHPLDVRMTLVRWLAAVALAREGGRFVRVNVLGLNKYDIWIDLREVGQVATIVLSHSAGDDVVVLVILLVWV